MTRTPRRFSRSFIAGHRLARPIRETRPGPSPNEVFNPRALREVLLALSLSPSLARSLARPRHERPELHAYNPFARSSFLPPYVRPLRRCIASPILTTMRLPSRSRDATTTSPRVHRKVARYPFPSFPLFTISLSLSSSRARALSQV